MIIRQEQIRALEKSREAAFEKRLIAHVCNVFSVQILSLTEAERASRVGKAVKAARQNGFTTERNLAFYTDLDFVFGEDFGRQSAWARNALASGTAKDEEGLRRRLFEAACAQDAPPE